jgi:hypothetical protein
MIDQALLNHAAGVLKTISADQRADTALRYYFERHGYIQPPARRVISHAVFVYFRWFQWLDEKASPQKRLEQAQGLHERFTADPKSIKTEALAALAVPDWLKTELTELPADYSSSTPARSRALAPRPARPSPPPRQSPLLRRAHAPSTRCPPVHRHQRSLQI